MAIKKAIITTAGFGTRFLPITKTIQKEMLPILNRPIIDYVVEDCIKAGIKEIIFVVNEHNKQTLHFYRENKRLYNYLKRMDKLNLYDKVAHLHSQAKFTFVKQKESDQYGTAVPVLLAKKYIEKNESFLVFMGDDFIFNTNGNSEAARMIALYEKSNAAALATCIIKPKEELFRYGVADLSKENGHQYLKALVEKPNPGTEPSNLANISKYIFNSDIFEIIENQKANPKSGELYITDSASILAKKQDVVIYTPQGEYLDGGNLLGWLKANLIVAKQNPELNKELSKFIKQNF